MFRQQQTTKGLTLKEKKCLAARAQRGNASVNSDIYKQES